MIKNILDVCQRSGNIYMCTCVGAVDRLASFSCTEVGLGFNLAWL